MQPYLAAFEAWHARVSWLTFSSWLPLTPLLWDSVWSCVIPHCTFFLHPASWSCSLVDCFIINIPQLLVFLVHLDFQHLLYSPWIKRRNMSQNISHVSVRWSNVFIMTRQPVCPVVRLPFHLKKPIPAVVSSAVDSKCSVLVYSFCAIYQHIVAC